MLLIKPGIWSSVIAEDPDFIQRLKYRLELSDVGFRPDPNKKYIFYKEVIPGFRLDIPTGILNSHVLPYFYFETIFDLREQSYKIIEPQIIINAFNRMAEIDPTFEVRPHQVAATIKCLARKHGICECPTGCFTGDTKVKTNRGSIRFDKLIKSFKDKKVYSSDGKLYKIKDVFISKYVDELIELKFDKLTIRCTPDHRFLLKSGIYKAACDLTENDDIAELNLYHCVYKVTNLINNKTYVGKHSTNDLSDKYLGSSLILKKDIKTFGRKNFKKEILAVCNSEIEAYEIENKIVNKEFVSRDDTYNVITGGCGFSSEDNKFLWSIKSIEERKNMTKGLDFSSEKQSERSKKWNSTEQSKIINRNLIIKYNKSEKGRNESKNRAQYMRKLIKNYKENDVDRYILLDLKRRLGSCIRNHSYYNHNLDIWNCEKCKHLFMSLFKQIDMLDKNYLIQKYGDLYEDIREKVYRA